MINSEIVCDSINPCGVRIVTQKLTYPRIVHSEFLTHRVFSKNASSSRAVPAKRMINNVVSNPFIPIEFQKAHSGMQGSENMIGSEKEDAIALWLESRDVAIIQAYKMLEAGITKQLINRILEPYQYYQVLMTSTEFDNFFELRDHEAAEIHIQALARTMQESMNLSIPKELEVGEWHIPYGDNMSYHELYNIVSDNGRWSFFAEPVEEIQELKLKIATARCARISYETLGDEPNIDYKADLKLYNTLLESKHFSPFEHCALAQEDNKFYKNFKGWKQFREVLEEN